MLQVLASAQTDTFYGDRHRKSIVRSGLEMSTFGLVTGRLGVRRDNESQQSFQNFGFGIGTDRLRLGKRPLEIRVDYASVDDDERSSMYSLNATLGL